MGIILDGVTIQLKHDTAATWATNNDVLALGELGLETDTNKGKFGDGTTAWNSLAYVTNWGGAGGNPVQRTGSAIAFDQSAVYNTPDTPSSSAVSLDLSGAVPRTRVVLYCNNSSEPTWPSGVRALGAWDNGQLNEVTFTYIDASNIVASIVSDANVPSNPEFTTIIKAANTVRPSTSVLAADPHLTFNMEANTKYLIKGGFLMQSEATPDFKFRISGPAAPSFIRGNLTIDSSNATPVSSVISAYSASDITILGAGTYNAMVGFTIAVENGPNAGAFEILWAQNTSNAANTIVWRGVSHLEYKTYP
jgi:hypothetical protein